MNKLVIATSNEHKLAEFKTILEPLGLELFSLKDFAPIEIIEDGDTFAANSLKKATSVFQATGLPSLADDSGLAVAALGGAPGVHSARFSGVSGADKDRANRAKLLLELGARPIKERGAAFHCVLTLITKDGELHTFEGISPGHIALVERGKNGFGYDSLFIPAGYSESFAELAPAVKNELSHRGRAAKELIAYLAEHPLS